MPHIDSNVFKLAPVAMWIEDFSGVKALFDGWRSEGVTDIRAHLKADMARVAACSRRIKVVGVNDKTLELFEAEDFDHLVQNLSMVFRGDMLESHIDDLEALWNGKTSFSSDTVNYSLSGRRMDIQLKATVMPGHEKDLSCVLMTTEDVTDREEARRQEARSRLHAEGLFKHSPISLWVEDFSQIKVLLDDVRDRGIDNFRVFLEVHPEFVHQCMSEIRVLDVNQATLDLFSAPDFHTLLRRQVEIFRDDMEKPFREQLIDLWEGRLVHSREVVNYALDDTVRHILLHFAVTPGYEHDWSRVQIALADITARKKAEVYLEYLGNHDVLTKLHNRNFYTDELNRLEHKRLRPVSVLIVDLNGLKEANDNLGHDAGDALLRRFGEVLNSVVTSPFCAARIGGDEFAVLMPGAEKKAADAMIDTIYELMAINNQFYSTSPLSAAIGVATSRDGETMEETVKRADHAMYEDKQRFHKGLTDGRSRNGSKIISPSKGKISVA
ncbi:sensor domain-containing diguanylate cyclase [Pseudohoeflea suaedae]|uniref:Sensor domain-containing diguanylate cyclase n=1 Tax=Pseudohoeflea suaedae TaxID=877384 RepID=A0A4R5PNK7_9HYPH|nr:sensor domain-containing diguanylate cyclase [Pseudohoeflea suaedae]TDH38640.1 sensor domain-containing diguanylate cyclase [Pseudohoeflea suaedae]